MFSISVGKLPPGQKCTVSMEMTMDLDIVSDTEYRMIIPTTILPRWGENSQDIARESTDEHQVSGDKMETCTSEASYSIAIRGRMLQVFETGARMICH